MLYDIDREQSVKTIHEHHWKEYAFIPCAATIYLQNKPEYKDDVVNDDCSEESSDLSKMSIY